MMMMMMMMQELGEPSKKLAEETGGSNDKVLEDFDDSQQEMPSITFTLGVFHIYTRSHHVMF